MVFRLAMDNAELLIKHSSVYHLTLNLATVADIQITVEIMKKRMDFHSRLKISSSQSSATFLFFSPPTFSLFFSHLIENHFLEYN